MSYPQLESPSSALIERQSSIGVFLFWNVCSSYPEIDSISGLLLLGFDFLCVDFFIESMEFTRLSCGDVFFGASI